MQEYGKIIKQIRLEHGLTLKQFSEQTGLSVGFLSKIERGINNPSFSNLQKICFALGVSSSIFETSKEEPIENRQLCFRKEDRSLIYSYDSGVKMESLLSHEDQFKVSVMTLSGHRKASTSARHSQNEFGVIIRGSLRITMNDQVFDLDPEDAILVPAGAEHTTERLSKEDCVSLWIKYE